MNALTERLAELAGVATPQFVKATGTITLADGREVPFTVTADHDRAGRPAVRTDR